MIERIIPSSGERLPVYGLGTWARFNVPLRSIPKDLSDVLKVMSDAGAKLIDSSPMYGNSEEVIGKLTAESGQADDFFYATKVWTTGQKEGILQMENSFRKMGRKTMDLMQVHNLEDWKTHLKTLREWKEQGKIRYLGITHYTDTMHAELEKIIRAEELDFVQFNYSIFSRNAEKSLLNTAAERGVATLINKPLGTGLFFEKVKGKKLPPWAKDFSIETWSQFFLLYIISHPAVTCVIPASANPKHVLENLVIMNRNLPNENDRKRMVEHLKNL